MYSQPTSRSDAWFPTTMSCPGTLNPPNFNPFYRFSVRLTQPPAQPILRRQPRPPTCLQRLVRFMQPPRRTLRQTRRRDPRHRHSLAQAKCLPKQLRPHRRTAQNLPDNPERPRHRRRARRLGRPAQPRKCQLHMDRPRRALRPRLLPFGRRLRR